MQAFSVSNFVTFASWASFNAFAFVYSSFKASLFAIALFKLFLACVLSFSDDLVSFTRLSYCPWSLMNFYKKEINKNI